MKLRLNDLTAIGAAAVLSGAPSTIYALASGTSVLAATRAAGTLLGRPTVPRGIVAHAGISLAWGSVLVRALPRSHRVTAGLLAGAAIATLDLGVIGRRIPGIRALPRLPQWADHLAFGALIGIVLDSNDRGAAGGMAPNPHLRSLPTGGGDGSR